MILVNDLAVMCIVQYDESNEERVDEVLDLKEIRTYCENFLSISMQNDNVIDLDAMIFLCYEYEMTGDCYLLSCK